MLTSAGGSMPKHGRASAIHTPCRIFCTTFKLYWDVVHDFGFTVKFWELRPTLLYPRNFYFFAMLGNLILRCGWVITISPGFFGVDHLGRCGHDPARPYPLFPLLI